MAPITVAVLGATGSLGQHIAKGLLSPQFYPEQISRVVVLTRDASSDKAQALKAQGAELLPAEPKAEHFKGIDVFVNAASSWTPEVWADFDQYTKAAVDAGVKVYFPSDFGVDHWKYPEETGIFVYNLKRARVKFAEEYGKGKIKVVTVSNGAFLGWGDLNFGKAAGFDHLGGKYEVVGDPSKQLTLTHLRDIGLSVARLAILAVHEPASVPDVVRISGDAKSPIEIAKLVEAKTGKPIEIVTITPEEFGQPAPHEFVKFVRLWSGLGRVCNLEGNSNELINPGEKYWRWTRVEEWMNERPGNYPMGSASAADTDANRHPK